MTIAKSKIHFNTRSFTALQQAVPVVPTNLPPLTRVTLPLSPTLTPSLSLSLPLSLSPTLSLSLSPTLTLTPQSWSKRLAWSCQSPGVSPVYCPAKHTPDKRYFFVPAPANIDLSRKKAVRHRPHLYAPFLIRLKCVHIAKAHSLPIAPTPPPVPTYVRSP